MTAMRVALLVLVTACGSDVSELPDAALRASDAAEAIDAPTGVPDDGFGYPCGYDPLLLLSECRSREGVLGYCVQGICRRRCFGEKYQERTCPGRQAPIPTVGAECFCEPRACNTTANCYVNGMR